MLLQFFLKKRMVAPVVEHFGLLYSAPILLKGDEISKA